MCSLDEHGSGLVIRPSAEELLRPPRRDLLCPEPGCGRRLPQPSALRFHVQRMHRRQAIRGSKTPAAALFACPEDDCTSFSSARKTLFASLKALKQHYMKVHAPRTHVCPECCVSAFATEALLRAHQRVCGAHHHCSCGAQFANIATLRSHAARHGHKTLVTVRPPASQPNRLRRLAPKPAPDALHLLASIALAGVPARPAPSTSDASTQTAARRAPRGGRSSGTQTRLTIGAATAGTAAHPTSQRVTAEPAPDPLAAVSAGRPAATGTAASQAGRPLVCELRVLWPPATVALTSCQTQTEAAPPLEQLLWEAQTEAEAAPDQLLADPPPEETSVACSLPPPLPPTAGSQTEADTLSAQTQTQDPFNVIKHLLRSDDEQLLFPELSELSCTDIQTQTPWLTDDSQTQTPWLTDDSQTQTPWLTGDSQTQTPWLTGDSQTQTPWLTGDSQTQTPWLTGDSQTQTPWWTDDPARLMTSQTQTAPVTHMETQTCLLCLGPCHCWDD